MSSGEIDGLLRNLDQRVERIEQILPALATREELRAEVAPLATRDEMRAAIRGAISEAVAPLATRAHMDLLFENLRDDIKLIANGHVDLDRRVTRLEQAGESRRHRR